MWEVEYTDTFGEWWGRLSEREQDSVAMVVGLLEARGPHLSFPYRSGIESSRFAKTRELRIQHAGKPYRVLYAFDPRRCALLLLGGCKAGKANWYRDFVPVADRLFAEHLAETEREK